MSPEACALLAIHGRNDQAERDRAWYRQARVECAKRALALGVPMDTYIGVVAAMSPRMPWLTSRGVYQNLDAADRCFRGEGRGLKLSVARAQRILDGEDPLTVLGTTKTASFYKNLRSDTTDAVTIDTWMVRAMDASPPSTQTAYDRLANAVREAADHAGLTPHALQASVWSQIKREQGSPNAIALEQAA